MSRIEREKLTVRKMIELYCRHHLPRRRSHVILQGQKEILNLLGIIIHYFIVPLQHGYGFTEFLHITSERGLRNGSLSVVGILHRGSVARIRTAEVLCQLSFA
jgi:hypothetical protein